MKGRATITRKRSRWSEAVAAAREAASTEFPGWEPQAVALTYAVKNGSGWNATLRLEGEVE